jgi:hypothetical protein
MENQQHLVWTLGCLPLMNLVTPRIWRFLITSETRKLKLSCIKISSQIIFYQLLLLLLQQLNNRKTTVILLITKLSDLITLHNNSAGAFFQSHWSYLVKYPKLGAIGHQFDWNWGRNEKSGWKQYTGRKKKKAPEAKLVFAAKLLLIKVSPTPVLDVHLSCTFTAGSYTLWLNLTPFSE